MIGEYFNKQNNDFEFQNIQVQVSGDYQKLPIQTVQYLDEFLQKTKNNTGLVLNLCINYGARDEIVRACNRILQNNNGDLHITEKDISQNLYTWDLPEVDLLIRSGGEQRLSNFLLWQSAYSEIYFTDTLWPDMQEEELCFIFNWYNERKRRFGGLPHVRN